MSSQLLIDPRDAAVLESQNLLGPVSCNRRQLARSTAFSSEATTTSISSSNSSYRSDESLVIPVSLVSEETLVCLGFDSKRASQVWARWLEISNDEDFGIGFIDVAIGEIESQPQDAGGLSDDWRGVLTSLGISEELREKIMSDDVQEVRLTASAKFWASEAVESRYLALEKIQQNSITRAEHLNTSGHSFGTSRGGSGRVGGSEGVAEGSGIGSGGTRTFVGQGGISGESEKSPAAKVATTAALSTNATGETILWKGIADCRLRRSQTTNEINFDSLISGNGPNDVRSSGGTSYYFSPQREVGEIYAKMAAKTNHYSDAKVIKIIVPNKPIESLPPLVLSFGDTFKRIVYRSRGEKKLLTEEYRDLKDIHSAPLIIAPICKSHDRAIGKLSGWQEITEANLLTFPHPNDPEQKVRGIQHVFQGDEMQWRLMEMVKLEEHGLGSLGKISD